MTRQFSDDILFEKKKSPKKNRNPIKLNPLFIHILIILLIIIGLFFYFSNDISFNADDISNGEVILIGDLDKFSKNYRGNLFIESGQIFLETNRTKIKNSDDDFFIKNFNGIIYLYNKTIIFEGVSDKIIYGDNEINLINRENFKLISKQTTTMQLFFKNIELNFDNGRIILDNELNYEFKNTSINLEDYNLSLTYDGSTFSFYGISRRFELNSSVLNLKIIYENKNQINLN